jgi:hypothetical protein
LIECAGGALKVTDCLAAGLVCEDSCEPTGCHPPGKSTPCGALPAAGHCAGGNLFECVGGAVAIRHCRNWGQGDCARVDLSKFDCPF